MKASNSSRIHTADDGQLRRSRLNLRLTNPFYLVAGLWLLILLLYCLSWSNLCVALDPLLVVFVCALICSFLMLGFHFQDQLGIQYSDASTVHGMEITSAIVCIVLVAGMVYNSNVPLISVLEGKPYNTESVNFPFIGTFFTAVALWQTARLSYCYQRNSSTGVLIQLIAIVTLFFMTVQRQNIMVCIIAIIFSVWTSKNKGRHYSADGRIRSLVIMLLLLALILFAFGAIGNARYGMWAWNDSSMISAVGGINDRYPAWLPREYIWAYIYLVSPLANLNNNLQSTIPMGDYVSLLLQLIPSSIAKRIMPSAVEIVPYLVQPSLTASTSYANAYILGGVLGMFMFMLAQQLLIFIMARAALRDGGPSKFAGMFVIFYYAGLTFFDNPSAYLITSYLWIIVVLHPFLPQISNAIKSLLNRILRTN